MKRLLPSPVKFGLSALFFFTAAIVANAQTITGKISDEAGKPMSGVSIAEKGTAKGVTSAADGAYSIAVSSSKAVLVFSYVGYSSKEIIAGDAAAGNVVLAVDDLKRMEQVVVVGYGTQRRKDLTGAVGSVSSKDIEKIPTSGVDKALQGQVAGLQISTTSGAPGGNTNILVRGVSSISGGVEPLFVVDGYPVTSVGYSNPLSTINPADIESIDVLKDASATAIYGSRGSNGVIIITTKRGRTGKPRIEFDSYVGFQEIAHKIKLMDAQQHAAFVIDARNAGYIDNNPTGRATDNNTVRPGASWDIPDRYLNRAFMDSVGKGTAWQDHIFRQAPISNYQLTVSGGNEAVRYSLSGGYFQQQGILINTDFKRYNFKANIDAKLSDKLNVGASILPSVTQENTPQITGHYGGYGLIVTALSIDPTVPVYNPDGSYSYITADAGQTQMANPIKIAREYKVRFTQSRFFTNAYADYAILPALKLRTSFGADLTYYKRREFKPSTLATNSPTAPAFANAANNEATNWLSETTVSYRYNTAAHRLDAVAGFTAQSDFVNTFSASANNFADDLLPNINGGTVTGGSETVDRNNILSFLARANYVFKGKYLLTATIRRDGSSRFGENRRWGNFPSGAIGWRVSEEAFMKNVPVISDLKLRASYGVTGNNAIGNYRALSLLSTANYIMGDVLTPGTVPGSPANLNLGWESQNQVDIGIDLSFFNNRISLVADYYDKRNKDMLFIVQTPSVTGFTSATVNLGEVQNKGYEFTLNTRNLSGKLGWNTNFNITFNRNKVLAMSTANDKIFNGAATATNTNVTMVGQPIGVFYGRRAVGVFATDAEARTYGAQPFATAGDVKFKDIDNNGKIDDNDREVIGTPHPDYFFGFNNSFSFKGFTLDVLTNGMVGQSIYSGTFTANNSGVQNNAAFIDEARWRSTDKPGGGDYGQLGRAIRGGRNNNFQYSSLFLYDASFFRIRQVNVGYNLPATVTGRVGLQSARVYAGVTNLHTFTKYWGFDPEVGNGGDTQTSFGVDFGTYPLARTFTLGVNVSF